MENRKYRKIITRLRASYGNVFGIINRNGEICACSDESRIGKTIPNFHIDDDYVQEQGFACCAVTSGSAPQYAVFVQGEEASAKKDAALLAAMIAIMSEDDTAEQDRRQFLLETAEGKTQDGDFYGRMKTLGINASVCYLPVILRCRGVNYRTMYQAVDSLLTDHEHDHLLTRGDQLILLKMTRPAEEKDLQKKITADIQALNRQYGIEIFAGIGDLTEDLYVLPGTLQNAERALICAEISDPVRYAVSASETGYAGLLSEVPEEICRTYLGTQKDFTLDEEMAYTARKFLASELNITDAAKELFINRNTLVYRLNKIQKETGLDLKKFEDAMTYSIIVTMKKILKNREK